jgi:hypothetical protein
MDTQHPYLSTRAEAESDGAVGDEEGRRVGGKGVLHRSLPELAETFKVTVTLELGRHSSSGR